LIEEPGDIWKDPVSLSKHIQSTSIGRQNAGAREWRGGALNHIWSFLQTGFS